MAKKTTEVAPKVEPKVVVKEVKKVDPRKVMADAIYIKNVNLQAGEDGMRNCSKLSKQAANMHCE